VEGNTKDKTDKGSKRTRHKQETVNRKEIRRQTKAPAAEEREEFV